MLHICSTSYSQQPPSSARVPATIVQGFAFTNFLYMDARSRDPVWNEPCTEADGSYEPQLPDEKKYSWMRTCKPTGRYDWNWSTAQACEHKKAPMTYTPMTHALVTCLVTQFTPSIVLHWPWPQSHYNSLLSPKDNLHLLSLVSWDSCTKGFSCSSNDMVLCPSHMAHVTEVPRLHTEAAFQQCVYKTSREIPYIGR
jgi:hypothetical protein